MGPHGFFGTTQIADQLAPNLSLHDVIDVPKLEPPSCAFILHIHQILRSSHKSDNVANESLHHSLLQTAST
ncbi:hypothetical protein KC339_g18689, partial [Hortaea werneckii]